MGSSDIENARAGGREESGRECSTIMFLSLGGAGENNI
jgi:hypothetical protein